MFADVPCPTPRGYQEPDTEILLGDGGVRGKQTSAWYQVGTGLASWPFLVSFVPTDGTWARPVGKVGGEVKLSISYKNNKLFIMVMHIRGLVSARSPPVAHILVLFWLVRPLPPSCESDHKVTESPPMGLLWGQTRVRPSSTRHSFLPPVVFGK